MIYFIRTCTCIMRSPPIHFLCCDSFPCTNLVMTDVELLPVQGPTVTNPFCWNGYGTIFQTPKLSTSFYCLVDRFSSLITQHMFMFVDLLILKLDTDISIQEVEYNYLNCPISISTPTKVSTIV